MWGDLARALISFFAIIDPLGNVLVFHLLTRGMDRGQRIKVATVSVVAALVLAVVFSLGGREVLDFLGISPHSFQVAAGALLILPAYRMVERGSTLDMAEGQKGDVLAIALVPLATPLLVGPGALATAISFSRTMGLVVTVAAPGIVLACSWLLFLASEAIFRLVEESAFRLITRLVGILLMAIAVDFILEGVSFFF